MLRTDINIRLTIFIFVLGLNACNAHQKSEATVMIHVISEQKFCLDYIRQQTVAW